MNTPQPPPLDPIYCRRCKALIESEHNHCGHCGWDQSKSFALAEIEAQEIEAAERRLEVQAQQVEAARQSKELRIAQDEARKQALYNHPTGHGICPHCKSPNVKPYSFTEGGSGAGQSMACCLGCAFNPLAWLLIPLMQGKKRRGMECNYCSNKWRL